MLAFIRRCALEIHKTPGWRLRRALSDPRADRVWTPRRAATIKLGHVRVSDGYKIRYGVQDMPEADVWDVWTEAASYVKDNVPATNRVLKKALPNAKFEKGSSRFAVVRNLAIATYLLGLARKSDFILRPYRFVALIGGSELGLDRYRIRCYGDTVYQFREKSMIDYGTYLFEPSILVAHASPRFNNLAYALGRHVPPDLRPGLEVLLSFIVTLGLKYEIAFTDHFDVEKVDGDGAEGLITYSPDDEPEAEVEQVGEEDEDEDAPSQEDIENFELHKATARI